MGDDSVTHRDLARHVGVSETTIKSYRRKFPEFFPPFSMGKPIRFRPQALEICEHIRRCFKRDLSVEETRSHLGEHFPEYKPVRGKTQPPATVADKAESTVVMLERVVLAFESFTSTQQEANRKLDTLQEMLGDFLSLHLAREDAFSKGVLEIKRALTWLPTREAPRTDTPTSRRITVRNVNGGRSEYLVQSGTDAAKPAKDDLPPESLLKTPLVIRSQTGDYLGIAGKGEGSFCLLDFSAMHRKAFPAPHGFIESWSRAGDGWVLVLEQEDVIRPSRYELVVDAVETPKGNKVALLFSFTVNGRNLPTANLYTFIKQMRDKI